MCAETIEHLRCKELCERVRVTETYLAFSYHYYYSCCCCPHHLALVVIVTYRGATNICARSCYTCWDCK